MSNAQSVVVGAAVTVVFTFAGGILFFLLGGDSPGSISTAGGWAFVAWSFVVLLLGAGLAALICALAYGSILKKRKAEVDDLEKNLKEARSEVERLRDDLRRKDEAIDSLQLTITRQENRIDVLTSSKFASDNDPDGFGDDESSAEHLTLCRRILRELAECAGDSGKMDAYVMENLGRNPDHAEAFRAAFNDLIEYKCIDAWHVWKNDDGSFSPWRRPAVMKILKTKYPTTGERVKMDAVKEAEKARKWAEKYDTGLAGRWR